MSLPSSFPRQGPAPTPVLSPRAFVFHARPVKEPEPERHAREKLIANNLDHANHMLSEANRIIAAQEERIRKLESLIQTDELTGLANRRGLTLAVNHQLALARRSHEENGLLILIEAERYEALAETGGQPLANAYLQTIASVLIHEVRTMDSPAYLGRGRFAILMPRIEAREAGRRLEHLQDIFHKRVMHHGAQSVPLSGAFGYALLSETESFESLMTAADTRLYSQKAHRALKVS